MKSALWAILRAAPILRFTALQLDTLAAILPWVGATSAACGSLGLNAPPTDYAYLAEPARLGVAMPEAMQRSQHKSVQQAASYYNDGERSMGRAVRMI